MVYINVFHFSGHLQYLHVWSKWDLFRHCPLIGCYFGPYRWCIKCYMKSQIKHHMWNYCQQSHVNLMVSPSHDFIHRLKSCRTILQDSIRQGFWYFAKKKAKFRGIFRGKFAEKSANFVGFSQEKSQNSREKQVISGIFPGKKSKFAEKSADFAGFSREKSQNFRKNWPTSQGFSGKKSNFEGFLGANC